MPKLRTYLQEQHGEAPTKYKQNIGPALHAAGQPATLLGGQSELITTPSQPTHQEPVASDDHFASASRKFSDAYNKRLREHGPRRFRWPDGSLQESKPPPSPYAAANRRKWSDIVHYCRTHGGDRVYDTTGQSLRYGINVPTAQHVAYLQQAQLQPEIDSATETQRGFDPNRTDPLKNPEHALNSYYKERSEVVFAEARGRLL